MFRLQRFSLSQMLFSTVNARALGLFRSLYCLTIADNLPVVSFHDSCGLPRVDLLRNHLTLGEIKYDAVKHLCTAEGWAALRGRLEPQAQLIARRLQRQK